MNPHIRTYYLPPQPDLWLAYYLEPAHLGLMVPRRDTAQPYPEDLIHTLTQYTKGELPRPTLATIFRQHPAYKTTNLDPFWKRRTRLGNDAHRNDKDSPRKIADEILNKNPEDELIAYRIHTMPDGRTEFIFCPRSWIHCWTHHGKWPTVDDIQPRYSADWREGQAEWRRMGLKWHLPVRPQDVTYAHGFIGLSGHRNYAGIYAGPPVLMQAVDLLRRYLPTTAKEAVAPVTAIEYLIGLDIDLRLAFLAPGYAVAKLFDKPPHVHCTDDGRIYADRISARRGKIAHGQEED